PDVRHLPDLIDLGQLQKRGGLSHRRPDLHVRPVVLDDSAQERVEVLGQSARGGERHYAYDDRGHGQKTPKPVAIEVAGDLHCASLPYAHASPKDRARPDPSDRRAYFWLARLVV